MKTKSNKNNKSMALNMTKSNEEENCSDSDLERALDGSLASSKKGVKSKMIPSSTLAEKVTATIACGAVATAACTMFLEAGTAVVVASVLSAIIAPYAAYQQRQLTEVKGLQELHGNLQNQVDELEDHNDDLNAAVDDLGETISGLQFVETALSTITETSGKSITQFSEQVSENKSINDDMTVSRVYHFYQLIMGSCRDKHPLLLVKLLSYNIRKIFDKMYYKILSLL
uniref:Uncharacterized protein n=1 Tax=Proboscia inermis TaxID=420281 RepID=A0A7S0CLT3_9STRA|mmetsp:Transcript_5901/g.6138  ORF Transcript_5901/g.6138 Transcript_5901/m.6138 type:complete len:228 (+) Transcript_5901:62-745(+)